ncbi:unnamed protein product [Schistocephalus solidus]|uniref:SEC7 domain-containing protein n=1 Tax=Schistocephalus solidus TaxID=70667 RepID=A0A183TR46_SCHSO|nr:unnamed protein product [Schistocephalus solidus]
MSEMSRSSEDTVLKDILVKKDTKLYPLPSSPASSSSPNRPDATMVAAITGPYSPPVIPHNSLPILDQPPQPRVSHADPRLAPGPYDAGHNQPASDCTASVKRNQTGDEFAPELKQLARRTFPNLPPSDRDDLVLDRFTSGLRDHAVVSHFILNPPTNLTDALQLCRRYDSRKGG